MPPSLESCIGSMFEPGNPGNATDSGAITIPRYPTTWNVAVSESATAAATLNAGLAFVGTVTETASAADTPSVAAGAVFAASIAEAAAAVSAQDAAAAAAFRTAMAGGTEPVQVTTSAPRTSRLKSGTVIAGA